MRQIQILLPRSEFETKILPFRFRVGEPESVTQVYQEEAVAGDAAFLGTEKGIRVDSTDSDARVYHAADGKTLVVDATELSGENRTGVALLYNITAHSIRKSVYIGREPGQPVRVLTYGYGKTDALPKETILPNGWPASLRNEV